MMAKILTSNENNINTIVDSLQQNMIVALPTDTVYGLGGNATNIDVVKNIFHLKKRDFNKPLSVNFHNINAMYQHVEPNKILDIIAQKYLPGALTLIVNKNNTSNISNLCSAFVDGKWKQAVRIPNNLDLLNVLSKIDFPICLPSANISGLPSSVNAQQVLEQFSHTNIMILNTLQACSGVDSTILDISSGYAKVIRLGSFNLNNIRELGIEVK